MTNINSLYISMLVFYYKIGKYQPVDAKKATKNAALYSGLYYDILKLGLLLAMKRIINHLLNFCDQYIHICIYTTFCGTKHTPRPCVASVSPCWPRR